MGCRWKSSKFAHFLIQSRALLFQTGLQRLWCIEWVTPWSIPFLLPLWSWDIAIVFPGTAPMATWRYNFASCAKENASISHQMIGTHHQQVTINFLVNLFLDPIMHVSSIARIELVDDNPLCQLNRQAMLVNGNLLHQVPALDPHFLVSQQVLDNDVCHVFPEGITLSVQAMNSAEDELVVGNGPVLASHDDEAGI